MRIKKRIHVAPLGYELDRIVEPLVEYQADEFVLVVRKNETYGRDHQDNVEKKLMEEGIPYVVEEAELLDLVDCISVFGRIVHNLKKQGHEVYVNISTSTSISAVGASFAAMLWDAVPYYARPEREVREHERKPGEPMSQGLKDVILVQSLHFEMPDVELLRILKFISTNARGKDGVVKNKEVMEHLRKEGYLELDRRVKNRSQALNKKFRERYRDQLEVRWGFVFLMGETRDRRIGLTKKGEMYLKMFEYLV